MRVLQQQLLNSLRNAASLLQHSAYERLFVVLDEPAYEATGARHILEPFFQQKQTLRFTGFELNPKWSDLQRGMELYQQFQPDFIIALGGGTAIDLAKLIATLAVQSGSARNIALGRETIIDERKPLMAIPTTAGTGSEATHFAVIYIDGNKYSVAHPSLLPDYAVVDASLTESLPRRMTAATGLDAFCQAIESLWAVAANEESMGYAAEAAQLAYENLEAVTNQPTPQARQAMCQASHLAGQAINLTKTTAPHALSYFLTSHYGIPHGFAVACTLVPLLKFNAAVTDEDCSDPRGAAAVQERISRILSILGAETIEEASMLLQDLLFRVGCPLLGEIIDHDGLVALIGSANGERLSNNPRRADRMQLMNLFSQMMNPGCQN